MSAVVDPYSGMQMVELSHIWGHGAPSMPGDDDVVMFRSVKHAQHGVMAQRLKMVMHTGTHMNTPMHLIQKGAGAADIPLDRFFGNGVILHIPKKRWDLVTAKDLAAAKPDIKKGDIVVIVTDWYHKYSDSLEYFGESPGLSKQAAEWLVKQECKLVAVDTPQVDHPLATSLGPHRGGPLMNRLTSRYREETGLDPKKEHPDWNIAHKTILAAGIPTIEQVGGDVSLLLGKRATFMATPWNWKQGDACPVRFVAMTDPSGNYRLEAGHSE